MAIFTSLSLFFCVASFSFSSISFFEGGCGFEDNDKVKLTGAFIIGKRKHNPWQEYENDGDGLDSID